MVSAIKNGTALRRTVLACSYLITIAFSIKALKEPDVWWQIRTGEWILEHHQVPVSDVFSYTQSWNEWINIKWGFEVIAALISKIVGPESICFLQAFVSCLIFYFLLKTTKLIFKSAQPEVICSDNKSYAGAVFVSFILAVLAIEYRMNSRPEMISHLFTVLFVYIIVHYRSDPSKKIFLLIPLQVVWANMHEAYGAGIIIQILFLTAAILERWWLKDHSITNRKKFILRPFIVLILSIAAMAINPNGIRLITRPLSIFGQVLQNKYTTELLPVSSPAYWQKEAYLALLILLLVISGLFFLRRDKKKSLAVKLIESFGAGHLFLLIAFLYLALTAYRNIVFLILVLFPFLVVSVYRFITWLNTKTKGRLSISSAKSALTIGLIGIVFYALIVSNTYYETTESRDRFGAEITAIGHPTGAADYILQQNLSRKKCFSDYLTSSYLLWRLQPDFKTFIDLRDLDVFSPAFFSQYLYATSNPYAFHSLDSVYRFDYAVLYRQELPTLHKYLYNDSIYALTYLDAVAAVYQKTDSFSRKDIFSMPSPPPISSFAKFITGILNPFYSSFVYKEVNYDIAAATYYLSVNAFDLAEVRARKAMENKKNAFLGTEMLGRVFYSRALQQRDSTNRNLFLDQSLGLFQTAQKEKQNYSPAYSGAGAVYLKQFRFKAAANSFEKALQYDGLESNVLIGCAESYLGLSRVSNTNENLGRALDYYLECNRMMPGNAPVLLNIGFIAFRLKKNNLSDKYLTEALNTKLLSPSDQQKAEECLRQLY